MLSPKSVLSASHKLSLCVLLLGVSCSGENFRGGGNKGDQAPVAPAPTPTSAAPEVPGQQTIRLTCEGDNPSTNSFTSLNAKSTDSVKIEGEFCPSAFAQMSVLFVVDISGSMGPNNGLPGNDPDSSNCGRLQSAQAIVNKIAQKARPQDKINISVVTFSGSARIAVPWTQLASASSVLKSSVFCQANGSTDYGSAFQVAQTALAQAQGSKTIYFISDGQPQVNVNGRDTQAEQDGLAAANSLKAAQPTAAINAIFLGSSGASGGFDPQSYLAQITGSADRVRLASAAGALADQILQFAFPEMHVVENTAKGTLKIQSTGTSTPVELDKFEKHPTKKGVWSYSTKPFKPQGKKDTEMINQVSITAQDTTGKEQTANIVISYKQAD